MELVGYIVSELGELRPDGGIDLIVKKKRIIRSRLEYNAKKYYKEKITVKEMLEFLGALVDGGFKHGIYITLKGFAEESLKITADHNIDTWDAERLIKNLSDNEDKIWNSLKKLLNSTYEYCHRCGNQMTLKKARCGITAGYYFLGVY